MVGHDLLSHLLNKKKYPISKNVTDFQRPDASIHRVHHKMKMRHPVYIYVLYIYYIYLYVRIYIYRICILERQSILRFLSIKNQFIIINTNSVQPYGLCSHGQKRNQ